MYGKQTETAIAAVSRLAEVYDGGKTRLTADDIAEARGLQRPFVAKILTTLSQAGLVVGSRGPGGGYALARPPKQIRLREVYQLFQRADDSIACPFGGGVCGAGHPCAIHDSLVEIQDRFDAFLESTNFEIFRYAFQVEGHRPVPSGTMPKTPKRASFRAPRTRG